jgi:hypothetical protein
MPLNLNDVHLQAKVAALRDGTKPKWGWDLIQTSSRSSGFPTTLHTFTLTWTTRLSTLKSPWTIRRVVAVSETRSVSLSRSVSVCMHDFTFWGTQNDPPCGCCVRDSLVFFIKVSVSMHAWCYVLRYSERSAVWLLSQRLALYLSSRSVSVCMHDDVTFWGTQNHWVCEHCTTSGILNNYKTWCFGYWNCFRPQMRGKNTRTLIGPLEWATSIQYLSGPNRIGVFLPSPEDGNTSRFRNVS